MVTPPTSRRSSLQSSALGPSAPDGGKPEGSRQESSSSAAAPDQVGGTSSSSTTVRGSSDLATTNHTNTKVESDLAPGSSRLSIVGASARAPTTTTKSLLSKLVKERLIGNGADGKVFLMRDPDTGSPFAVKEMILTDAQLARANGVKRQIEALQRLPDHPHVIRHYGCHLGTCSLHVLMEFVPGGSLSALLGGLGAFHEAAVRKYARQLCEGLAFLHEHNVVHRDIKGANCLINADGRLQIADFGSSVVVSEGQPPVKGLQGTAHWMSPESINEIVTPKGDVWALGCTVIEMATARSPWADARFTNDWAAMFHISQCGRGPPIPPHLSRQAHHFLRACFDINPDTRPTAAQCLDMPFLAVDFDDESGDRTMQPPDDIELTPQSEHHLPRREDSPLGTEYASTFSSVSFAPIDPDLGDAELPNQLDDASPTGIGRGGGGGHGGPSDEEELKLVTSEELSPLGAGGRASFASRYHNHHNSNAKPTAEPVATTTGDSGFRSLVKAHQAAAAGGAGGDGDEGSSSLMTASPAAVRPSDILAFVSAAARGSPSTPVPSSTEHSTLFGGGMPGAAQRSLVRLEEAVMFNLLGFLPVRELGRLSTVSHMFFGLIDADPRERLWRKLFTAIFGPVDDVRAALRKSWKLAFRSSAAARSWQAGNGRYRVRRRLAHSANVFEADDLQGGAIGSREAAPCIVKIEAIPRPKSRAASTPTKRSTAATPTQHPASSPWTMTAVTTATSGGVGSTTPGAATVGVPSSSPSAIPTPPAHHHVSPGRAGTANRSGGVGGLPPQSPIRPPVQLPHLSHAPLSAQQQQVLAAAAAGPDPAAERLSRLPPTQGGRFTFIRPGAVPPPLLPPNPPGSAAGGPRHLPPAQPYHHHQQPHPHHHLAGSPGTSLHHHHHHPTALGPHTTSFVTSPHHTPASPGAGGTTLDGTFFRTASKVGSANAEDERPSASAGAGASTHPTPSPLVLQSAGALASAASTSAAGAGLGAPAMGISSSSGGRATAAAAGATGTSDPWSDLYEFQRSESFPAQLVPGASGAKPVRSSAQHQYRILRHLDAMGVPCVPRPLYLNTDGADISGHSVLVTSRLGPSLSELLLFSGNQLSTRTVMTLALKLLTALADMHDRDVVHGGLTPSTIVMGTGATRDQVHFVNFSHARFYRDPKTHRASGNVLGAANVAKKTYEYYCFCSTSVQRGCTPCPRDDVISIGYVLCYLTHGSLPWAADGAGQLDGAKLVRAKTQYLEKLATTPPLQLFAFLKSAYALKQGDSPDYVYLCSLVRRIMRDRGWNPDAPLDWDARASF